VSARRTARIMQSTFMCQGSDRRCAPTVRAMERFGHTPRRTPEHRAGALGAAVCSGPAADVGKHIDARRFEQRLEEARRVLTREPLHAHRVLQDVLVTRGDSAPGHTAPARACRPRDHLRVPARDRQHRDHPRRPLMASTHDPRRANAPRPWPRSSLGTHRRSPATPGS
jgi:hypothetical protein